MVGTAYSAKDAKVKIQGQYKRFILKLNTKDAKGKIQGDVKRAIAKDTRKLICW